MFNTMHYKRKMKKTAISLNQKGILNNHTRFSARGSIKRAREAGPSAEPWQLASQSETRSSGKPPSSRAPGYIGPRSRLPWELAK